MKGAPGMHSVGSWMGPRAGVDIPEKNIFPYQDTNPITYSP